jgi:hypothetical protein
VSKATLKNVVSAKSGDIEVKFDRAVSVWQAAAQIEKAKRSSS